jgi:hypothetical protein
MKISLGGIAVLAAGVALAATPAPAQMHGGGGGHFGGGGGHFGAGGAGFHPGGGFRGPVRPGVGARPARGAWRGGWHGGDHDGDGDRDHHHFFGGFFWPGWGFYDPFFWGAGYAGVYAMGPYDGYDSYDEPYDAGYPDANAPQAAAPAGYDCDGWRWDAGAGRYVAAKVSCN